MAKNNNGCKYQKTCPVYEPKKRDYEQKFDKLLDDFIELGEKLLLPSLENIRKNLETAVKETDERIRVAKRFNKTL